MTTHFLETTEGLSVPHLMCWRTEGTFTTAGRCCGVFVILAPDVKLQTYLLTYVLLHSTSAAGKPSETAQTGPHNLWRGGLKRPNTANIARDQSSAAAEQS